MFLDVRLISFRLHLFRALGIFCLLFSFAGFSKTLSARVIHVTGEASYLALKTLHSPAVAYEFTVDNTGPGGRTYTKSTNIGLDILSTLTAVEQGVEDPQVARDHIATVAKGLSTLRCYEGIFPEYVHIAPDGVFADVSNGRIRFSSIDSAWLHLALSVAEDYYRKKDPVLSQSLGGFVEEAHYGIFLHDGNKIRHGVTVDSMDNTVVEEWPYNYDNKNSEARLCVVFLTAIGKIPDNVWRDMTYKQTNVFGVSVADGWKLSAFVELTANTYFDEDRLAPMTLGRGHTHYLEACRRVATQRGYSLFGWAPCYNPQDRYQEYGLSNPEVTTPYAAALLTTVGNPLALQNFHKVVKSIKFSVQPMLFPDALDSRTGVVLNQRVLSLNQNLLYQALARDAVQRVMAQSRWYKKAEGLIRKMDLWHCDELKNDSKTHY